jgi:hypothetical protein
MYELQLSIGIIIIFKFKYYLKLKTWMSDNGQEDKDS